MFQNKNDTKQHMRNVHDNVQLENNPSKSQNEASFLELMQKSLEKMLPKILQNMVTVPQDQSQVRNVASQQTGPNVQQVGWELVRQNMR